MGALLTASPLTGSARLGPSLVLGMLGGSALLAARMRRASGSEMRRAHVLARPSLATGALLLLAAIVFAPTIVWLYREYTESIWRNGHGMFVPLFMILLARSALRRDASTAEESSAWGFAFLLPALTLVIVDAGVRSHHVSAIGLVLALPGLSLLLLGARRTRSIAAPLALGIFLIPVPAFFEDVIRLAEVTAIATDPLFALFDVPVIRHQTLLLLPHDIIGVRQNCSGLSALCAGLAFAALLAATGRSRVRGLLLLLAVYPAVVVVNALRSAALVLLVLRYGIGIVHLPIHGLSGIGVFAVVLALLWLCGDRKALREALS